MPKGLTMDRRVKEVLELLKKGKTRKEIAEKYNYSSYRSLQQYMRRKNYYWNSKNKIYEQKNEDVLENNSSRNIEDSKLLRILSSFDKEYPDARKIAEKLNFKNYEALKKYMYERNYIWSSKKKTYIKSEKNIDDYVDEDVDVDIDETTDFIDYLYDNQKILKRIIKNHESSRNIPNYAISGETSTKTIYMSTQLSNLIKEYSDEKGISQKQVVESALIEFLKTYGYEKEIDYIIH